MASASPSPSHSDISTHSIHAGAGTALLLTQLSALIPGLLPTLALVGLVAALLVLPALVLGLAAALVLGPPVLAWRLITRARRRTTGAGIRSAPPHPRS